LKGAFTLTGFDRPRETQHYIGTPKVSHSMFAAGERRLLAVPTFEPTPPLVLFRERADYGGDRRDVAAAGRSCWCASRNGYTSELHS
jgi:hypothetical protein